MILRLAGPASRWALLITSLIFGASLSYYSARNARAEQAAASQAPEELTRATRLEPGNARNWYLLGHHWQYNLDEPNNARAIVAYQQSLSFDPRYPAVWLDLGEAYEEAGNLAAARHALLEAKRNYPISAEVAWRYGNFLLRQGEFPAAFSEIRKAVQEEPRRVAEAISRCWRADPDIQFILDRALPAWPQVYLDVVRFLAAQRETDAAVAAWARVYGLKPKLELKDAYPLLDALLQKRKIADARAVWAQALELTGVARPSDPPGSLIWDGGFETEFTGGGFAWRIHAPSGTQVGYDERVKHCGTRALRIRFDGTQNVNFEGVCQYVPVEPGMSYEFSGWLRAETVTTDRGIYFRLSTPENPGSVAAATPELTGTEGWSHLTLPWRAGKDAHLLWLCVARLPSQKFDNKIEGTVWVDDVSLIPAERGFGTAARAQP